MSKIFSNEEAKKISDVLGAEEIAELKDRFRLKVNNAEDRRNLVLEIFPEAELGKTRGMLVVIYTGNSHLQLHNCTGYVISEELGEVTFVAESNKRLSGLVVERGASCSSYAALNRDLISSDFTTLGVEVMLSGVAMSLVEDIVSHDNEDSED